MPALKQIFPSTNLIVLDSGDWKPSDAEAQKALVAIGAILEDLKPHDMWQNDEVLRILRNSKKYPVQFVGITSGGKKIIWCNFFPAATGDKILLIIGGAAGFWLKTEGFISGISNLIRVRASACILRRTGMLKGEGNR